MDKKTVTIKDILFIDRQDSTYPLHIGDGLNYGLSFFETLLVTDHCVFSKEHTDRINHSLDAFQIPLQIPYTLFDDIVTTYNLKHIALKVLVSDHNVLVSTRPLHYRDDYYDKGLHLALSPIVRSSNSYLCRHKSSNYGDLIMSFRDAKKQGYDDCIFFNEKGYVCESAIANIFVIKYGQIFTPSLDNGLLPGIVRQYVIDHYNVIEKKLSLDDLVFADGIFLTNSLVGMVKVSKLTIDKHIVAKNRFIQMEYFIPDEGRYDEHPLYTKIRKDYLAHIQ